jgi:hypothetical protein
MDNTKNDLCFNEAKLDFEAMVSVTEYAYSRTLQEIARATDKLHRTSLEDINPVRPARDLKKYSAHMAVIAETLHTLYEARERDKLTIVNRE